MTALHERRVPASAGRSAGRRRQRRPVWTAWLMVIAILAGGVYLGKVVIDRRTQPARTLLVEQVRLTADELAVGPADSALVEEVLVQAGALVPKGDVVARVRLQGGSSAQPIVAPDEAVVVRIERPTGTVVRAGEPVVVMYAPASLRYVASVPLDKVSVLRAGMTASLAGPGGSATASVQRVVPSLQTEASQTVDVVLVPADSSAIRSLVPGLPFRATIDLSSAPDGLPVVGAG